MEKSAGLAQLAWIIGAAAVFGGGIYSSAVERRWLDIRRINVTLNRLPPRFSGFRIALLSDIHLGFFFSSLNFSSVTEKINLLKPDVVCFAGDFLDSGASHGVMESVIPALSKLDAPFGKYAVLGNHDHWAGSKRLISGLGRGGVRVLINDRVSLKKGDDRIFFIGLDDVLAGKPDLERAAGEIPETACKILIVHEPDYAVYTSKFPVDLQLSGHSHGGQVCLPFLGPVVTSRLGKKYPSGLYRVDKLMLYTTRGLGTTVLPVRFFCRPELTIITLLGL